MMKRTKRTPALLASALLLCASLASAAATSHQAAGFNLFSVDQDVEIGRQSAVEAERQLTLLGDGNARR